MLKNRHPTSTGVSDPHFFPGELEEAIGFYQKGLSQKGDVVAVLNSIGDCYFKPGNKEQALRAWEKSFRNKP